MFLLGSWEKFYNFLTVAGKKIRVRVMKSQVDKNYNILASIRHCIPVEFARKTRSLKQLAQFKASEFRLLLLYVLPTVLSLLPNEIYEHFLLLHCAIRILSFPERVKFVQMSNLHELSFSILLNPTKISMAMDL